MPILSARGGASARAYGWGVASADNFAFESIASSVVSSGSTAVTFNSIPSTYYALYIRIYQSVTSASDVFVPVTLFNNDNATARYRASYFSNQAGASGTRTISQSGGNTYAYTTNNNTGVKTLIPMISNILIPNYTDTGQNRNAMNFVGVNSNNGNAEQGINNIYWNGTSAISRLDFSITLTGATPTWGAGNVIALYGIKGGV